MEALVSKGYPRWMRANPNDPTRSAKSYTALLAVIQDTEKNAPADLDRRLRQDPAGQAREAFGGSPC